MYLAFNIAVVVVCLYASHRITLALSVDPKEKPR